MIITSLLSISCNSIIVNKKRSFLTIFSISIGIALIISIYSLGNGAKESLYKLLELDSNNSSSTIFFVKSPYYNGYLNKEFKSEDISNIKKIKNIKEVQIQDDNKSYVIPVINNNQAIEANIKTIKKNDQKFKSLTEYDYINQKKTVIVNENFIKDNFDNKILSDKIINIAGEYFKIKVFKNDMQLNENIIMQESTFKKYFSMYPQKQQLKISYDNINEKNKTNKTIDDYFVKYGNNKNYGEYVIKNPEDLIKMINSVISSITNFIAIISSISLLIAGISVMNMMYTLVLERTEEIAIRRACGASKWQIQVQFLIESAMITILGGIIGIFCGYMVSYIISVFLPFKPIIYLKDISLTIIISIIIGLFFGWYPAKNASQKELINIIR